MGISGWGEAVHITLFLWQDPVSASILAKQEQQQAAYEFKVLLSIKNKANGLPVYI